MMVAMKKEGKATVNHKEPICPEDLQKLYKHEHFSLNTPEALQKRVFFEYLYYFCNRGRENIRDVQRDDFELKRDAKGLRYVRVKVVRQTKNQRGDDFTDVDDKDGRMYEIPGSANCPVRSFTKYFSKLHPDRTDFWQRPKLASKTTESADVWYDNSPVGKNTLGNLMAKISEDMANKQRRLLLNDPDVLHGQMVRMENAIANLNITVAWLEADKDLLSQQVSTQTKLMTQLQTENKWLNKTIETFLIKGQFKTSIFAVVTGNPSIGNDQTLKFDSVKTNNGGCYDPITGIFIAPSSGSYHFTCVTYNINMADDVHLKMNKNTDILVHGYSSGSSEAESQVMNIVVNLKKGDHIYVLHRGTSGIDQVRGGLFSTFSGFKL
ncbi:KCTD1_15 [Mytilus coruscus]|uniref:KCTD1_15 n=1 Tax=Mytilus coruscus TaxID=42192 RepID=A0A6J8C0E8_MYTCO|nr:KCTD1_15 [Mytilus coruscus]